MRKKILLGLLVLVVAIQFIRPAQNRSATPVDKDDFLEEFAAPADVRQMFAAACYDCHSHNTRYPWYANVQPVGWWLKSHIDEGLDHLDLTEFGTLGDKRQGEKLDAIMDEISDRTMPLKSYTWIHRDARLTEAEQKRLLAWLGQIRDKLPAAD